MPLTTEIIIAAGCIVSAGLGFLLASVLADGKAKTAERRAWREAERLHRARSIQDLRDSTRLF